MIKTIKVMLIPNNRQSKKLFQYANKKNKQKLNWLRLAEHGRIAVDCKYMNPRIKFDGINWWITVSMECKDNRTRPSEEGTGIDLGIKDFAVCSDKTIYKNINKTWKIWKSTKR